MGKINDWLEGIPSAGTRKSYKNGIKRFEKWYGKPVESLLESQSREEAGRVIEKFYVAMKNAEVPQNTARITTNAVIQFLKYNGIEPRYRKSIGIYKTVIAKNQLLLTVDAVQKMGEVADLKEQIILEVFLLGLRIGDVARLEWKDFLADEFQLLTSKEEEAAWIFIAPEFRDLLNKYLPQLDKENKYLLQSSHGEHLTSKQLDNNLKTLAKRASVGQDGKLIHWHLGRKLVLRTGAELGLNQWSAKMLVGKAVSADIATYIQGTNLKNDAAKLQSVLKLKKPVSNGTRSDVDKVMGALRLLIEDAMKRNPSEKISEAKELLFGQDDNVNG
jgi:site-specific recombinase XerD